MEKIINPHIPSEFDPPELVARKKTLRARSEMMREHFSDAMRLYDLILIQAMRNFGGGIPTEITAIDTQTKPWGIWIRDMKRAIDASNGQPPAMIPFPPLPSWFEMNPAISELCERLGVRA
jgi:hypothetical protein